MSATSGRNPLMEAALDYASRGWPVLPVHTPMGGNRVCSCGAADCGSPGKHPRTTHGVKDATVEADKIREWWARWPDANVGIAAGQAAGIFALDIDPRHGGDDSLAELESQHGALLETVEARTGGGGRHLLFTHPGLRVANLAGVRPGLDVRSDGGFIVAAPSLHASGESYIWLREPDEIQATEAPGWLIEIVQGQRTSPAPAAADTAATIPDGQRNSTLTRMAGAMRRQGMRKEEILAGLLAANRRCSPPMEQKEVEAVARSVSRYAPHPVEPTERAERAEIRSPHKWPDAPDPIAFSGLAGRFVELVSPHSEADPIALLFQFHAALGSAIGRSPHFIAEADRHGTNLNVVLVGETAKGRKGSSWGYCRRALVMADPTWEARILTGLSSGEGLIWQVRDPIMKREKNRKTKEYEDVEVDPGVADKRMLVYEGEFASVLKVLQRDGNTLSALMRNAWDCGDLRSMTKNSPAVATGAHVSVIAHVTRQEVNRYLDRTEAGNGFGNRFLWVCVRRSKLLPEGGRAREGDLCAFAMEVRKHLEAAGKFGQLERDPEANQLWREVYPDLSEGKPGLLGAMVARSEAQVMRLAMLYALENGSGVIRVDHLRAALALWRYAEASAAFVFGESMGDPMADAIFQSLRAASDGLTRTQIRDLFGRNKSKSDVDRALGLLLEHGLAGTRMLETGGRAAEVWFATTKTTDTTEAA